MRMARIVSAAAFGAALLALSGFAARADETADRHAAAAEVLRELHSVDMINALLPSILAQIRQNLTRNDPDLMKEFDTYAPHLKSEAEATEPALMDKLADVYANTFTADELRDMLTYYRSPIGQRIIATQGAINQGMLAAARDWGTSVAQTMARDAAAELQGTHPAPPAN